MIFCNAKVRIKQDLTKHSSYSFDAASGDIRIYSAQMRDKGKSRVDCYVVAYYGTNPQGRTMAFTSPTDHFDKAAFLAAPQLKSKSDFLSERPDIAFNIDFCTWYLHKLSLKGWPRISKERLQQIQQKGYPEAAVEFATPVDGLRNTGLAMLHGVRSNQDLLQ